MSISRTNYAGTVPVFGRFVGGAGVVTNGAKLLWHKVSLRDSGTAVKFGTELTEKVGVCYGLNAEYIQTIEDAGEAEEARQKREGYVNRVQETKRQIKNETFAKDIQKIKNSLRRAAPFYGLKYSFDRLGKDKENVPFMKGTPGKLDTMCLAPVLQQIIGVPRLAYHSLVLVVSGALAVGTYAANAMIEKAKPAPEKGEDAPGEGTWQTRINTLHEKCNKAIADNKPKATRDLYRSIPFVGSFFSSAYIEANPEKKYDKM